MVKCWSFYSHYLITIDDRFGLSVLKFQISSFNIFDEYRSNDIYAVMQDTLKLVTHIFDFLNVGIDEKWFIQFRDNIVAANFFLWRRSNRIIDFIYTQAYTQLYFVL